MLRSSIKILLALVFVSFGTAVPVTYAQEIVGINAAIRDKVQTRKYNKKVMEDVKLKGRVSIGDYIRTSPAGVLQILLRDRTSLTIGKNGSMTIDRFVYDPQDDASEVVATITKGAFRFISGKPMRRRKGKSSIRTPVGSIGVRGTIFDGAVGEEALALARSYDLPEHLIVAANEEATFVVLRGPGVDAQANEESGAVDLTTDQGVFSLEKAGDAYFIPRKNARPFGPFRFGGSGFYWDQGWNFAGPPPRPRRNGPLGRGDPNQPGRGGNGPGQPGPGGPPPIGGNFEVGDNMNQGNVQGVP